MWCACPLDTAAHGVVKVSSNSCPKTALSKRPLHKERKSTWLTLVCFWLRWLVPPEASKQCCFFQAENLWSSCSPMGNGIHLHVLSCSGPDIESEEEVGKSAKTLRLVVSKSFTIVRPRTASLCTIWRYCHIGRLYMNVWELNNNSTDCRVTVSSDVFLFIISLWCMLITCTGMSSRAMSVKMSVVVRFRH